MQPRLTEAIAVDFRDLGIGRGKCKALEMEEEGNIGLILIGIGDFGWRAERGVRGMSYFGETL
jgi:hypothetical protein